MHTLKGCFCSAKFKKQAYEDRVKLASETPFTVNEIEALYDLFKKLSGSIINDGLIHKEEFLLALFRDSNKNNLFADRVFDLFDVKGNGVIEFGEFVRSLSIFHPSYPQAEKVACMLHLDCTIYEVLATSNVSRFSGVLKSNFELCFMDFVFWKVKDMVLAVLNESDVTLSDDDIESIVDKTMSQADTKGDGKIDFEEWKEFVEKNPALLKNMTLPYLKELTLQFPSFVLHTEVPD